MTGRWVRLYDKLLEDPIFTDCSPHTFKLAIYCLLKASWKATDHASKPVPRGSLATDLPTLALALKVTVKQIRNSLDQLTELDFLKDVQSGRGRLITVVKYEAYQGEEPPKFGQPIPESSITKKARSVKTDTAFPQIEGQDGNAPIHNLRLFESEASQSLNCGKPENGAGWGQDKGQDKGQDGNGVKFPDDIALAGTGPKKGQDEGQDKGQDGPVDKKRIFDIRIVETTHTKSAGAPCVVPAEIDNPTPSPTDPTPIFGQPVKPAGPPTATERLEWFTLEFWPVIWEKIGVGAARRVWLSKVRDRTTADQVIAAAVDQGPDILASAISRGHSVLHPATWLNQERFLDQRTLPAASQAAVGLPGVRNGRTGNGIERAMNTRMAYDRIYGGNTEA